MSRLNRSSTSPNKHRDALIVWQKSGVSISILVDVWLRYVVHARRHLSVWHSLEMVEILVHAVLVLVAIRVFVVFCVGFAIDRFCPGNLDRTPVNNHSVGLFECNCRVFSRVEMHKRVTENFTMFLVKISQVFDNSNQNLL